MEKKAKVEAAKDESQKPKRMNTSNRSLSEKIVSKSI